MTANRTILVVFSLFLVSTALGQNDLPVRWGHQLSTPTDDGVRAAVVDSNDGIYFTVKRQTKDASGATTSKGVFLLKYSQKGAQLWSKQLDPGFEYATGLAADDQGNIYLFGFVSSTPERETKGKNDVVIAKYDQTGTQQWIWQLGTPEHDVCTGLDFDADENIYVSGYTYGDFAKPNKGDSDMFIAAYDKHRGLLWRDQIGSAANDRGGSIHLGDDNDVYVCGDTFGSLARKNNGLADSFVARYQRTGKRLWLHQFGTYAFDSGAGLVIGELGHLYLGCRTNGNVGTRSPRRTDVDSCLVSISKEGRLLWTRQFGTDGWDGTWAMARFQDGSGDLLISGCQVPSKEKCRAYCRRYTPEGKLVWTKEFREYSSKGGTCGRVAAIDSANNVYHGGITHADLFGVNNGTPNVYIVRFDPGMRAKTGPEPRSQFATPTLLLAPVDWRFEAMPLPPRFAPKIKWTGFEEIRFAPGVFDNSSPNYFSYVIALSVNGTSAIDAAGIKDFLETYFRGLLPPMGQRKGLTVNASQIAAEIAPAQTKAKTNARCQGTVTIIDTFTDGRKTTLNVEADVLPQKALNKTHVLLLLSPRARDSKIWKTLRGIRDKTIASSAMATANRP